MFKHVRKCILSLVLLDVTRPIKQVNSFAIPSWLPVLKRKPCMWSIHRSLCFGNACLGGLMNDGISVKSCDLQRAHSPSVQFLLSIMLPLQWRPPLRGGGAWHSRLRHCVHSVPHADHLAHSVQPPSTSGQHTAQSWGHDIFKGSYSKACMKILALQYCLSVFEHGTSCSSECLSTVAYFCVCKWTRWLTSVSPFHLDRGWCKWLFERVSPHKKHLH